MLRYDGKSWGSMVEYKEKMEEALCHQAEEVQVQVVHVVEAAHAVEVHQEDGAARHIAAPIAEIPEAAVEADQPIQPEEREEISPWVCRLTLRQNPLL